MVMVCGRVDQLLGPLNTTHDRHSGTLREAPILMQIEHYLNIRDHLFNLPLIIKQKVL